MLRLLALCLTLAACAPATLPPGRDSGLEGRVTGQRIISDHPHHVLLGHVLIASRDGETTRALVIHHRRDGVHRIRMAEAWSQGRALPYRSLNYRLGCTHGHCRDNAVGFILLSRADLDRAAGAGFSATLIGPQGPIEIAAPPALFAEALAPP